MERNNDLMTIKEFAEASGRSQQTIYKQITTRLSAYLHEIEGQKYIDRKALAEVFQIGVQPDNQPIQSEENNSFNFENNPERVLYEFLKLELEAKNHQLAEKDKQIGLLQIQVSQLTEANKELAQSINMARKNELAGTLREMLPEATQEEAATVLDVEPEEENKKLSGLKAFFARWRK